MQGVKNEILELPNYLGYKFLGLIYLNAVHGIELVEGDGDRFLGGLLQHLLPLLLLDAVVQVLPLLEVDLRLADGLLQLQGELVLGELKARAGIEPRTSKSTSMF